MTQLKHTPTPWEIQKYKNYKRYAIVNDCFGCIAERWENDPAPDRCAEMEANAHLISAAPDMYDALKKGIECFAHRVESIDLGGRQDHPDHPDQIAIRDMRAALAKAGTVTE